ncbi:MAG TPA: amino acid adenylation domain-containing protein [Pyrinomonadaceae bacterium]|nr:amino acid adenylation domain-containing protein [Pyrinomonadaceae bacterium]
MQNLAGSPLSTQQERLWRLMLLDDSKLYRAQIAMLLDGALAKEALQRSLENVMQRHEILRTVFVQPDELAVPLQVVTDNTAPAWRETSVDGVDQVIDELLEEEWKEAGEVLRICLVKLASTRHALIVTLLSLCADRRSLSIIYNELIDAYASSSLDQPGEILQYADYAAWQHELLAEDDPEENSSNLAYWSKRSQQSIAGANLPFEAAMDARAEARVSVSFAGAELKLIDEAARRYEVSRSTVLLACWQTLLGRLTGDSDVVIGSEFDGRNFSELEGAAGLFARVLPIRVDLEDRTRFSEHVQRVQRMVQEFNERQQYFTFAAATLPTYSYVFAFNEIPLPRVAAGISFSVIDQRVLFERFKVGLFCTASGDALAVEFRYDPRVFDEKSMRQLASGFTVLVRSVGHNPEAKLGSYPVLGSEDRQRLLVEFNQPASPAVIDDKCFHEIFAEQAVRTPDTAALIYEDRRLTYTELNKRANQLAHRLQKLGVGPESLVVLLLDRSPEMIVAMLGVLKAGGAYVPLDTGQPRPRLSLMLQNARPVVVVTSANYVDVVQEWPTLLLDTESRQFDDESAENPAANTTASNLMYVIYTSGSSGVPKGVAVEHRQLINYLHAIQEKLQLPTGASYATVSTFAADLGNTVIFPALASGGTLHIMSPERIADPEAVAAYFEEHRIDCLKIVPGHFAALLSCSQPARVLPRRLLVVGGEASQREGATQVQALDPDLRILNHYGPTETTVGVLTWELTPDGPWTDTLPLGRPLQNTRAYVLDANLLPLPIGVPGELYVGGDNVTRGYLNQPDLTAEKFIPDPFSTEPGARLYMTGDLVRFLSDDAIEFLGRKDQQIKIRGYRIEPGEIAAQLELHPDVREAIVIPREDQPGERRLVAYVAAAPSLQVSDLRSHLAERLPEYMTPSSFVLLSALPRTPNGKIDRQALPAPAEAEDTELFVAPRTPVEAALAGIWAELLGIEEIGVKNSFFELGGHSLMAMQLLSRLRATFQLELPLRTVFEAPTIAELALVLVRFEDTPGQVERIAAITAELADMSPEAASEMLREAQAERASGMSGA